ncbi:unnamed protein product [Cochlearia groenlandica]
MHCIVYAKERREDQACGVFVTVGTGPIRQAGRVRVVLWDEVIGQIQLSRGKLSGFTRSIFQRLRSLREKSNITSKVDKLKDEKDVSLYLPSHEQDQQDFLD